jgi:hypothetical protein
MAKMSSLEELKKLLKEAQEQQKQQGIVIKEQIAGQPNPDVSLPAKAAEYLSKSRKNDNIPAAPENIEQQRWNDPLAKQVTGDFVTRKEMNESYGLFLQRIQQQMSTMGGGGETRLARLDDVDRSTIGEGRHLAYRASDGKFFFEPVQTGEVVQSDWAEANTSADDFIKNKPTNLSNFNNDENFITIGDVPANPDGDNTTIEVSNNVISVINLPANTAIGPIDLLRFDTTHTHEEERVVGTLCWSDEDDTLNLQHSNGVTQQIGQEVYGYVRNGTANTIFNGTAVQFSGAEQNGTARLLVSPMLADGTFPNLYGLGITTQDIDPGEDGYVTVWGKVRDVDTTGGAENWQVGDILYVSPTDAGELTNVKPTAPNNVVPMAAVLRVDATAGEIFVRPTVEQKMSYGKFSRTTDQAVVATNTAYVLDFDTTEISNGVDRVVGNTSRLQVDKSGLYQIDISAQVDATGGGFSAGTMFMWIRKNGVDVPNSTRRQGVLGSAPSANIGFVVILSLDANDYIEIAYAGDSTALRFDAAAATAFAPSTAAVKVGVTQIQL